MIIDKFAYQKLDRHTAADGVRHYICPDGSRVASVTTILSLTMDADKKQALMEWEQRLGKKKADEERTFASNLGSLMHDGLEAHIRELPRPGGSNMIRQTATRMANAIIKGGLSKVDEYWGVECALYISGLYAGTTDVVGLYEGVPSIMDFKNAKKMRKKEKIVDYFDQMAAYAIAHDEMFGTSLEQGVIFMCSRDCEFQEFVIKGDEFQHHKSRFLSRVNTYYEHLASETDAP